jgi:hypothetical protein
MRAGLIALALAAASTFVVEGCGGDVNHTAGAGTGGTGGVETDAADDGGGAAGGNSQGGGGASYVVPGPDSPDSGLAATQVDGVWVFQYDPQGWHEALLEGPASIVDGCLYIGDFLVVWHVDRLDELEEIIAAVQAGEQPVVAVGGFARFVGVDPDGGEPLVLPSVIADHCSAEAVWFGSPD